MSKKKDNSASGKKQKRKMMTRKEIKEALREILPAKRFEHTLGVEYTAGCLAMRYGADLEKALYAGLLHDCAKSLSTKDKMKYCAKYNLPVSRYEEENPELLHAKLGAAFSIKKYGITDEEILSAITWHTTGKPGMSLMDKILYVADYMEPNRDQAENLPEVRKLAFVNLDDCLFRILEDTVVYLKGKKVTIDPMTQETYEYYKSLRSQKGYSENG